MKHSQLLLRTQKEFPKDEIAYNAKALTRAGFIHKLMAGVHSYLPLGYRVRTRVEAIIREEMNALGSAEMLMPALHPKKVWEPTGRWEGLQKIMYQFKDEAGHEYGLGPTHEEIVAQVATQVIFSYTDLPLSVYQIQTKFRNEPRAKSGLLRGREFSMKDLYSFHTNEASLNEFYERAKGAYQKVFARMGLVAYMTEASGGDFSKQYSHEYMVETEAGEDTVMLCRECKFAQNKEIASVKEGDTCPTCKKGVIASTTCVEVGNIFRLGTKFSAPIDLLYKDNEGKSHPVVMGSYGIGVDRLVGTIVEVSHDDKGIIWPESVAPFAVHLLALGAMTPDLKKSAEALYTTLMTHGVETLYDDREGVTAGEKFNDSDLIGIPWRVVISAKTIAQGKYELKPRTGGEAHMVTEKELLEKLQKRTS